MGAEAFAARVLYEAQKDCGLVIPSDQPGKQISLTRLNHGILVQVHGGGTIIKMMLTSEQMQTMARWSLPIDDAAVAAMAASFDALTSIARLSPAAFDLIIPMLGQKSADLCDIVRPSAVAALEGAGVRPVPGEVVTACVAALIASDLDFGVSVDWQHGWPILSCGGETSHDSRAGRPPLPALHPRSDCTPAKDAQHEA